MRNLGSHLFIYSPQSTSEEWKWVFVIGAVFYIAPAIQFMIFGSADVQKWNNDTEQKRFNDNVEIGPKND